MKRTPHLWVGVLLTVLVEGGAAGSAAACECDRERPIANYRAQGDVIFSGRVVGKYHTNLPLVQYPNVRVWFAVSRVWKGGAATYTSVDTGEGNGDCGYGPFSMGQSYLIYASRYRPAPIRTDVCMPTKPISEAKRDLAQLGPGRPPAPLPFSYPALLSALLALMLATLGWRAVRRRRNPRSPLPPPTPES